MTVSEFSTNENKSKSVQEMDISFIKSKVKYKKDEPLVTDISSIKAPGYFKPLECGKDFLNNLDATY